MLGLVHSESEQPRPELLATWVDFAPRSATTARGPNPACQLRMGFTVCFLISWGKGLIFCDMWKLYRISVSINIVWLKHSHTHWFMYWLWLFLCDNDRDEWLWLMMTEPMIFTYYLALYRKCLPISTLSPRSPELLCANSICKQHRIFKAFQAKPNHSP